MSTSRWHTRRPWMQVSLSIVVTLGHGIAAAVQTTTPSSPAPSAAPSTTDAATVTRQIEQWLLDSDVAYGQHDRNRGRELLDVALTQATRHGLPALQAEALFRLGKHERWYHRFEAAREYYERSQALFLQLGNRGRAASVEAYLGTALSGMGEHARAYETLQRARATLREVGDVVGLSLAGDALMFAMEESPEKALLRPEVLADVRAAGDKATECNIGQNWGDGLFNAGRYAEAYGVLTDTVRCFEQTDDLGSTGRALVSLGRVERVHGQLDKALDNYTRALALQDQARDVVAAIQSLNAMAVTLHMLGRSDEAEARYRDALARARASAPHRVNFLSGNLGGVYLDMGRYAEAAQLLAASRAQEKDPTYYAWRTRQLAWASLQIGRPAEALALANESVEQVQAAGPEMRLRALHTRAGVLRELGRLEDARRDLADATRIVDDLRRHTLAADIMRRGFGETTQLLYEMAIDVELASQDGRAALAASEQARSRAFLDRLAARETARATDTTAEAPTAAPASVADIQALAARFRSTWLMFWVGRTATTVWVVQPSGAVHWRRLPIPATQLDTLVAQSVPRDSGLDSLAALSFASRAHVRPWRELYQKLLRPVSAYLPSTPGSRLTIVPHGPLFRLSFAALQDEQGRYLLERYDLHYVPAAGVLRFTATERRHARGRDGSALLVGDPPSLPMLGWARREVLSILKRLPRESVALVGADATETAVRKKIIGRRVIHFATHGVVFTDSTVSPSYLAVSRERDADGTSASPHALSDPSADGRLTADEIDSLTLDADLVVLSACGTALGPISGDGVQGFTRAFLSAGADSVIATTWSVADRTSYQVMERFYRGWLSGQSKARALRQAQLGVLRQLRAGGVTIDGVVLRDSPWLWAGFVLVGNP